MNVSILAPCVLTVLFFAFRLLSAVTLINVLAGRSVLLKLQNFQQYCLKTDHQIL